MYLWLSHKRTLPQIVLWNSTGSFFESTFSPDYWAECPEITPPGVKRSGIGPMESDQQTIDALQKPPSPLIEAKFTPCPNCEHLYPGKIVMLDKDHHCKLCGKVVNVYAWGVADMPCLGSVAILYRHKKESPMPEKPLCKDCKWINDCRFDHGHAICGAPQADRYLVDGGPMQKCETLRHPDGCIVLGISPDICGPEGRWFEAKKNQFIPPRPPAYLRFERAVETFQKSVNEYQESVIREMNKPA